jgi:hypothetical protein
MASGLPCSARDSGVVSKDDSGVELDSGVVLEG